jgi:hypothetical protein
MHIQLQGTCTLKDSNFRLFGTLLDVLIRFTSRKTSFGAYDDYQ